MLHFSVYCAIMEKILKGRISVDSYSRSGDFGEVKFFDVCLPSGRFRSLDHASMAGWHRVNEKYHQNRKEGLPFGILLLTLAGKGKVTVGEKAFFAEAGSVAVIPPHISHRYACKMGSEWEFFWLHIGGTHAFDALCDITLDGEFLFDIGTKQISALFAPFRDGKETGVEREIADSAAVGDILSILLKASVSKTVGDEEKTVAQEMAAFLSANESGDFSLDELVERFHYSKEYIIRLFKRTAGVSPYQYYLSLRLGRACDMLKKNEYTIAEIAEKSGYGTAASFSKVFKKKFGISPVEYRRLYLWTEV